LPDSRPQFSNPYADLSSFASSPLVYSWHSGDEEMVIRHALDRFHTEKVGFAIEIGAGAGRLSHTLAPYTHRLLVTDPSPAVLQAEFEDRAFTETEVVRALGTGESVINSQVIASASIVASYWSLTYELQHGYDLRRDGDGRLHADDAGGEAHLQRILAGLLRPGVEPRTNVHLFFDPASPEQEWVSKIWRRYVGAIPGGSRDYCNSRFLEAIVSAPTARELLTDRLSGTLMCVDLEHLKRVFLENHLRNLISPKDREEVIEDLALTMETWRSGGGYEVPASAYCVSFELRRALL